jgi:hypothetical protein
MRQRRLAILLAALLVTVFPGAVQANETDQDTETRIVQAKVVEVAEGHISVMARTGVEHVIAVDREATKVTMDGRAVSLKALREGDIATIELDAQKPVKFANNISMRSGGTQVARVRR